MLIPVPSPGVLAIGTEIKYDSSKVRIIPESSGFLCDFFYRWKLPFISTTTRL
jgi:hypothetical protein